MKSQFASAGRVCASAFSLKYNLLGGCAFAAMLLGAPAFAQQAAAPAGQANEGAPQSERIVVVGSRLSGVEPVGSPVSSLGAEDIEVAAVTSVDKVIQQLPQVFDLGVSESSRAQNGGSGNIVFSNTVNLRGIGPYATLVVIDGHRAVSNGRSVDPGMMPALGLARVEVLTDGASAVYGSDAVAGVVNLVPKRFVDGGQAFGRYGVGDAYEEHSLGASWGKTWSGGQVHMAYENGRRSNVSARDRDFARADQRPFGGRDYRGNQCETGNIVVGGISYAIPAGGVTSANAGSLTANTQNLCENLLDLDLLPEQTYNNFSATFNQQITDRLEFFADGLYSKREFDRALANGVNLANLTVPATNAFFVRPPGTTGAETVRFQFGGPTNDGSGEAQNWQTTGGLRYEITDDWTVKGLVSYGENRDISEGFHGVNTAALNTALASSDPATAFDPYGLNRTAPAVLAGILNQINIAPTNSEHTGYEAQIDGKLFTLPGGDVRMALGVERWELDWHAGQARGNPGTPVTFRNFSRTVDSAYLELFVPIVGDGNAMPGLQSLELSLAGRYDDYSDVGDTTNPKVGVNWVPVDGLKVRGSYGTSLRAPILAEIYGNSDALFLQSYSNPAGGAPIPGVALSGGNPNLKPEEATTWSVGADYEPDFAPGLKLSATYFDVEYTGQVTANLSDLAILGRASELAGTGIILQGQAATDRINQLLNEGKPIGRGPITNPTTVALFVDGRSYNLGQSFTNGVDLLANYEVEAGSLGEFNLQLGGTFITEYKVAATPAAPILDKKNTIFNPLATKLRGSVDWRLGWMDARAVVNHIGGYDNDRITPTQSVDAWTTLDLALNLSPDMGGPFDGSITFGIDVRNALDEDPPYVNIGPAVNGGGGFDPSAASPVGRVIAASVRKRF